MFYDNLKNVCDRLGLKVTPTIENAGIKKSNGSKWKQGVLPNAEAIIQLANYLNVSTDYLLLGKESKAVVLSDDERMLLDSFNRLSERGKGQVIERIKVIEENEKSITK